MGFEYVLTELNGYARSELAGATDKKVVPRPIGTMGTAGFKIPLYHEDADFLLEGDALLKVYDTDVSRDRPLFHGRLITADEVATANAGVAPGVACAFADAYWTVLKRLCGKGPAGYVKGTAVAPVDRGDVIIRDLVDTTNAESVSGLRMGNVLVSSSTYIADAWRYQSVGQKIAELCATLDGPDWQVRAIEYAGGYYGELDVLPVIGSHRPDAALEYGDGLLNVRGYKRAVSLEGTINRAYNLPPGYPDNAIQVPLMREDLNSKAERGLLEDVVTADLAVDELRIKLLEHHIAVRATPRQVITIELVTDLAGDRVPRFGRDFDNGDVLPFRASYTRPARPGVPAALVKRIDALFRLYSTEITVDAGGAGSYAVTVTPS